MEEEVLGAVRTSSLSWWPFGAVPSPCADSPAWVLAARGSGRAQRWSSRLVHGEGSFGEGMPGSLGQARAHCRAPGGGEARLSQQACPLPGGVDHSHAALSRAVRAPGPRHHAARRLQRHQRLPAHRLLPPQRGHGQCPGTVRPPARVGEGSRRERP